MARALGHLHVRPRHRGHLAAVRGGGGAGAMPPCCERVQAVALRMAEVVLREGIDADGALRYEGKGRKNHRCGQGMLAAGRGRHRFPQRLPAFGRREISQGRPACLGFHRAKTGGSRPRRMVLAHHAGRAGGPDPAQSQRMERPVSRDARACLETLHRLRALSEGKKAMPAKTV